MTDKLNQRIQSLDGLRAVSISLVLLAHIAWAGPKFFPFPKEWFLGYLNIGDLGVRVFFIISGFLITNILLKEYLETGKISLPYFYFKRFLRIFPAFYIFLVVISLFALWDWIPTTNRELWHAWTYTENYQPRFTWSEGHWFIGHTWSLAVEEQFYLLWPGVFAMTGLKGARKSAFAFILLAPAIRIFYALGGTVFPFLNTQPIFLFLVACSGRSFETVGDALATGCLLALFREQLWKQLWYKHWIRSRFFSLTFLVVLGCGLLDGNILRAWSDSYGFRIIYELLGITLMNFCIAMVVDRYIRFPETLLGKFLNFRFVVFYGALSYSIYLWQEPFLYQYEGHWLNIFPVNVICIIVFALLSYFFVEKPFLKLRIRLVPS